MFSHYAIFFFYMTILHEQMLFVYAQYYTTQVKIVLINMQMQLTTSKAGFSKRQGLKLVSCETSGIWGFIW